MLSRSPSSSFQHCIHCLTCILTELELLTTNLCWMAMSAAAFNDIAWVLLLALTIALSRYGSLTNLDAGRSL